MANIFEEPLLQALATLLFNGYQQQFFNIVLYTVSVAIYTVLVWSLYRFITRENIFVFEGMEKAKVPSSILLLMYLVVFPILTFAAFLFFALMLVFLSKGQTVEQILMISATMISAIRITSYYSEDFSREMAKLIPFTFLGVFLLDPTYYSYSVVVARLYALPMLFELILRYLLFIVLLEWALRLLRKVKRHFDPEEVEQPAPPVKPKAKPKKK